MAPTKAKGRPGRRPSQYSYVGSSTRTSRPGQKPGLFLGPNSLSQQATRPKLHPSYSASPASLGLITPWLRSNLR